MSHPTTMRVATSAAAGVALLAACGGGDSTGPRDQALNAQEAQVVAAALFTEVFSAFGAVDVSRSPASGGALRPAISDQVSANCARGGRIVGTFTSDDTLNDAGTGTVTGSMTITPQGCVVDAGSRTLTVNGDPSLAYTYAVSYREWSQASDFVWQARGGFAWTGGRCVMDYSARLTPAGSMTLSGTMCGQNIDYTVDYRS